MPASTKRRSLQRSSLVAGVAALAAITISGCIPLPPRPDSLSLDKRLAAFPTHTLDVRAPLEIRFDDHAIPFILAQDVSDVPYAIGLVHAHLRLGQMELLRRVSQGRVSEVVGPLATEIDRIVRTLDLGRATPAMASSLPDETRSWIERYVKGINDYRFRLNELPYEFRLLGVDERWTPWTVEDVLTIGRLASVDINWGRWFAQLGLRSEPEYEAFAERWRAIQGSAMPSFGPEVPTPLSPLLDVGKSGSNSVVVSGARTRSGAAMIASDPHLGLQIPNLWAIVGYRSPEGAVLGFTFPGLPFVVVGRNEHIAWGGTNMQGVNSTLYDVTGLPERARSVRTERIDRAFWTETELRVRETPFGPIISDSPFLNGLAEGDVALKWRGHEPSDEATAFLRVSRATDWESFRDSFATYATGGQNFLYADAAGNIGQLLAIEVAVGAARAAEVPIVDPRDERYRWDDRLGPLELPSVVNPRRGVLISCNNVPVRTDPPITVTGNANDRYERMAELLGTPGDEAVTVADLRALQQDVVSPASRRAAGILVQRARATDETARTGGVDALLEMLGSWDGGYGVDSRAASAYMLVLDRLIATHYAGAYGERIAGFLRSSAAVHEMAAHDLRERAISDAVLGRALDRVASRKDGLPTWGKMHRLSLSHPLARIPFIGGRFRVGEWGVPGTTSTVMKGAHRIGDRPASVTFGANARHISDMSDLDANLFVLVGGQDGWLGSRQFADQWALWQGGEYVSVPMREDRVRETFRHSVRLMPESRQDEAD